MFEMLQQNSSVKGLLKNISHGHDMGVSYSNNMQLQLLVTSVKLLVEGYLMKFSLATCEKCFYPDVKTRLWANW